MSDKEDQDLLKSYGLDRESKPNEKSKIDATIAKIKSDWLDQLTDEQLKLQVNLLQK